MNPANPGGNQQQFSFETSVEVEFVSSDRYRLIKLLGTGASGSVYLCHDGVLDKEVAVKCLRAFTSEQAVAFQEEARATSKLHHPNIVTVLDFGVGTEGAPYMVMDYVSGKSLADCIADAGRLEPGFVISIGKQLCDALGHAHSLHILHRDIKSSNILLARERAETRPILIDFGVAKLKSETQAALTKQGATIAGSPLYMAPDTMQGFRYDERSEIYSLGCVLFEALTGKVPFSAETALETMSLHANLPVPSLSSACPECEFAPALENLVATCLEKRPDDRFQSMSELKQAFAELDMHTSGTAGDPSESIGEEDMKGKPVSIKASSIYLALAGVCCVVLIFGYVFLGRNEQGRVDRSQPISRVEISSEQLYVSNALKRSLAQSQKDFKLRFAASDKDLALFKGYKKAQTVDLTDCDGVTDDGIKYLLDSPIKQLGLKASNVATLEYVGKLKKLESLNLSDTKINDESLTRISDLNELTQLDLRGTLLTDRCLPALLKLKRLEYVDFGVNTRVSLEAQRRLRDAKPLCAVLPLGPGPARIEFTMITEAIIRGDASQAIVNRLTKCIGQIEQSCGKDSLSTVPILITLSGVYQHQDKILEAKQAAERAVRIARAGGDLIALKESLLRLNVIYLALKDTEGAERALEELKTILDKLAYGRGSTDCFDQQAALASVFMRTKRFAESKRILNENLNVAEKEFGKKSCRYAATLAGLGDVLLQELDYKNARFYYYQSLELVKQMEETKPTQTLVIAICLGLSGCDLGEGKFEESINHVKEAISVAESMHDQSRVRHLKRHLTFVERDVRILQEQKRLKKDTRLTPSQ